MNEIAQQAEETVENIKVNLEGNMEKLLSIKEASDFLGLKIPTIYKNLLLTIGDITKNLPNQI